MMRGFEDWFAQVLDEAERRNIRRHIDPRPEQHRAGWNRGLSLVDWLDRVVGADTYDDGEEMDGDMDDLEDAAE